ncbi:MAG: YbbC/YhhH family protein [Bacteroidia bacterium]
MKISYKFLIALFAIGLFCCNATKFESIKHNSNYVPDEKTAIKVAEAIFIPIFGDKVLKERPFKAKLMDDEIWLVEGSLPRGAVGGVATMEIQKSDCKILTVYHTK